MDIQDLLDEVEEAIQDRPSGAKKVTTSASYASSVSSKSNYSSTRDDGGSDSRTTSSRSSFSHKKNVDDIDDILNMIDDDDDNSVAPVHPRRTASSTSSNTMPAYRLTSRPEEFQANGGSKKCSTLMVGGESAKRGLNTAFASHSVCANLRCNDCDFTVVQFLGKKWSANADYMFFRENVPNEAKLRARMESSHDSAAYACQCKWLSIDVPTRADMCRVKWSCAGH